MPTTHFEEMAREGAGFAGFACGQVGQGPHDPDLMSIPDLNALTVLPWRKEVAWVPGNLYVNGKSWPYCPRTILAQQLERARRLVYVLHVGVEPEFMLLKIAGEEYQPWDRRYGGQALL